MRLSMPHEASMIRANTDIGKFQVAGCQVLLKVLQCHKVCNTGFYVDPAFGF
jgi:hypothetical protein